MRNVFFSVLVAASLGGCFCGGYDGGGNRVYQRNDAEMLIFCENSGFVATLTTNMLEGRIDSMGAPINGESGEVAFDIVPNTDGTITTPQLGDTPWTEMNLDAVALDHANVLCEDLTTRAWWTAQ